MRGSRNKSNPSASLPRAEIRVTFGDRFSSLIFKLLRRPALWFSKGMPGLRDDIMKSNLSVSPEVHISLVLFFTMVSFAPFIIGVYLVVAYRSIIGLPFLIIPPMVFVIGLLAPKLSQSSRASAIDNELPFVVGYMTTLVAGGISPLITLRRLSKVDLYPAIQKEAKRILMDIDIFGMDPISALDKAARYNPNRALGDFLGGYTSVLKTGGDVVSYMETKLRDIFAYRTLKTKSAADLIGTFAEAYISLTVILGISFFVLFAIQSILGQGGSGGLINVIIFSAVFIPLVSMLFIFLVHSIQPREPVTYFTPYLAFSASFLVVPIMFLAPIDVPFYIKLGVGLLISVIPAAVINIRDMSRKKSVEVMLPSFLRDIAEVRKTGLAPERCIEQLSNRNYAGLTGYVRNMSSQLSWGVPLHRVIVNFSRAVRSWLTRAVAFLLLEVVDVGGGTVKMFGTLADFTQRVSEIEREKKSMLRPYIFIPYFGAVMVVITTLMMLYFLTAPVLGSPMGGGMRVGIDTSMVSSVLLSSALLTGWIMGFVAGKMGEGSVASGFKHSGSLVALSIITIYLTSLFLPLPA